MRSRMTRSIGVGAALATAGALFLTPQAALAAAEPDTTGIQILGVNDFHGRLEADAYGGLAGAAGLVGAVRQFESENPNTLFVSAGDNIGASTFTSFIQQDEPTMQSLAVGGLDVSAVGNHEFDKGYADVTDRVQPFYQQFGEADGYGADLTLGANVYHAGTSDPALSEYAIREVDGVTIGFIGTVTAETASLVAPDGVAVVDFGDQVEAANRVAAAIDDEVDVTVLLSHSGAAVSGDDASVCEAIANEDSEFGAIVRDATPEIDAIMSGHTHQGYPCTINDRPVVQGNDYGSTLSKLDIQVDATTNELVSIEGSLVPLTDDDGAPAYPIAEDIQAIVDDAVAVAAEEGNVPVGAISEDILRGGEVPGDDRGVESTMGNTVADVYLWATTEYGNYGGEPADLAVMNPGGLRDDLLFASSDVGEGDGIVTYAEAAAVQPFANTLTTSEMTGADIKLMLEQQWQPGDDGKLHLGVSEGFSYEYAEDEADGERIVSMTLDGAELAMDETYTVTTNSFIAAGGDNFTAFTQMPFRDTGLIDLEATVDFFAEHDMVDPSPLGRAIPAEDAEPEPEPEPSEEPEPQPSEEPGPDGDEGDGGDEGDELAPTGGDMAWAFGFGAAFLLAAGVVLVARTRKA